MCQFRCQLLYHPGSVPIRASNSCDDPMDRAMQGDTTLRKPKAMASSREGGLEGVIQRTPISCYLSSRA